jgi:transposase
MSTTVFSDQQSSSWVQEKEALLKELHEAKKSLSIKDNVIFLKEEELKAHRETLLLKDNVIFLKEEELKVHKEMLVKKDEAISAKEGEVQALVGQVIQLKDYLRQARQVHFGRKSEKRLDLPELPFMDRLFDEAMEEDSEENQPERAEKTKTRNRGKRKPLPSHFPREEIIHDLEDPQKMCPCGNALHKIGEEVSEQLEVIPATVKVLRHIRYKYGCKACEETVILASLPPQPIPKSMAAPGLLSHVMVSKYGDHLPLYRQEGIWQREGVDLDRATLGRWMMQAGELLEPLVTLMRQDILSSGYIQADETPLQVLSEEGRKATTKSYMWVYKIGGVDPSKIVYEYTPTREGENVKAFLKDFKGYLQTDGYSGYKKVTAGTPDIVHGGCFAHARRKFVDIFKASKKGEISGSAIQKIGALYKIEEEAKALTLSADERKKFREEHARPLLENLKEWLEIQRTKVPPKSALGQAIGYCLRQWTELTCYMKDGRLEIDNNASERCIKPFVIGRKNWLFSGNARGARTSALIYSIIETCKSHDINPFAYLKDIFEKIGKKDLSEKELKSLLPYHWKPTPISP